MGHPPRIELSLLRFASVEASKHRRTLRAGPWCWPSKDAPEKVWAHAWRYSGAEEGDRPSVGVGRCPVVSVMEDGSGASLWLVDTMRGVGDSGVYDASLIGAAIDAWSNALRALPRSLPFLWRPLSRLPTSPPQKLQWLNNVQITDPGAAGPGQRTKTTKKLDGPSFGLGFALALASQLLETPLPGDVSASACIAPTGALTPVEGLSGKVTCLRSCAPTIRRIFVARDQKETEALNRRYANEAFEVIAASHLSEVLEAVWGDRLEAALSERIKNKAQASEVVSSLVFLSLGSSPSKTHWRPLERTARKILDENTLLDAHDEARLRLVEMICQRHLKNEGRWDGSVDALKTWLEDVPAPLRLNFIAHLLQQSTDTGSPEPAAIRALAERSLEGHRGAEAFGEHLKVLGALARLDERTQHLDPAQVIVLQEEIALGWLERGIDRLEETVSFPLSMIYRLAGVTRDLDAFQRADVLYIQACSRVGLLSDAPRSAYIELSRARAQVELEKGDAATLEALERLWCPPEAYEVPLHLRWSAARWRLKYLRARGDVAGADAFKLCFNASFEALLEEQRALPRLFQQLVLLDEAIVKASEEDALKLIEALAQSRQAGWILQNLLEDAPASGLARAEYIARRFPY